MKDKKSALEYIMIKMSMWYMDINKISQFDFNEKNDLNIEKAMIIPYFICTANKNREILFKYFDKFIPNDIGMIEKDFSSFYEENKFKGEFIIIDNKSMKFKPEYIESNLNFILSLFDNIEIKEDIDHSINVIRSYNNDFINDDIKIMIYYSIRHPLWRVYYDLFIKNILNEIPFEKFLTERSMFSETYEYLMWT